jgi:hypothetical protein
LSAAAKSLEVRDALSKRSIPSWCVREAKRLRRWSPKGHQRSLRDVSAELAKLGFVNQRGVLIVGASMLAQSRALGLSTKFISRL